MFPTTPTTANESGREAIKRDFYDLDSLLSELNTPKEVINNTRPAASPGNTFSSSGGTSPELVEGEGEGQSEKLAPEIAALSGRAIAGTIDTVLSTGFSLYAKATNAEKFEATDKQMQKLSEAWAAVSAKYNYRVEDSPWFHIIALNAAIYIPKFNEAQNDRRFAEMDERFKEMEQKIKENEARINLMATETKPTA